MTLSDLASLGSFVSGIAVLISLIFLYFQLRQVNVQVRQAERNQQAAIAQGRTNRTVDIILTAAGSSHAEAALKGFSGAEDISAVALQQFSLTCRAAFYGWEDAFYQHRAGLMNDHAFHNLEITVQGAAHGIGWRTQWRLQRLSFGPEFSRWMDDWMMKTPLAPGADPVAGWKDALAAERSGAAY